VRSVELVGEAPEVWADGAVEDEDIPPTCDAVDDCAAEEEGGGLREKSDCDCDCEAVDDSITCDDPVSLTCEQSSPEKPVGHAHKLTPAQVPWFIQKFGGQVAKSEQLKDSGQNVPHEKFGPQQALPPAKTSQSELRVHE